MIQIYNIEQCNEAQCKSTTNCTNGLLHKTNIVKQYSVTINYMKWGVQFIIPSHSLHCSHQFIIQQYQTTNIKQNHMITHFVTESYTSYIFWIITTNGRCFINQDIPFGSLTMSQANQYVSILCLSPPPSIHWMFPLGTGIFPTSPNKKLKVKILNNNINANQLMSNDLINI